MFLKERLKLLGYNTNAPRTQRSREEGNEGLKYCTSGAWGCFPWFKKEREYVCHLGDLVFFGVGSLRPEVQHLLEPAFCMGPFLPTVA